MQKFAIAIGLLLSLLFLTGSGVNAENSPLCCQIRHENAPRTIGNFGSMPTLTGSYNPKAS